MTGPTDRAGHLTRLLGLTSHPWGRSFVYVYDLRVNGSVFQGPFGVGVYPLSLPSLLDYEEDGLVLPPVWVGGLAVVLTQVVRPASSGWVFSRAAGLWTPPGGSFRIARTVLQVSPLVRTLHRCY